MSASPGSKHRLFRKYVALIAGVVSLALFAHGGTEAWFLYQEQRSLLARVQIEQAEAAATKISSYIGAIEGQIGWTTQLPWLAATTDQRRLDAQRLLRQVPAITSLTQTDGEGREQLRVSRFAVDVIGSGVDMTAEPAVIGALTQKVFYSPIYFLNDSEPYMHLALTGPRRDSGVSIAEVNLKFIWEVVSKIEAGKMGVAYVVDVVGRLIAHPDISRVLRKTDLSGTEQVRAARISRDVIVAEGTDGRRVLSAHAPIDALGWTVFVDVPLDEAFAPLYGSLMRTGLLLLVGVILAIVAAYILARRMVVPIRRLQDGVARVGGGDLGHRVEIRTGDEIEALADQFNAMSTDLRVARERAERMGRLRRFLSPQIAEVIESSGGESLLESHRREITAVFCDLRGFTAFAESSSPEDVMRVLGEYHAALGALIHEYEGTLERFVGDGLLVLFNDPLPCPDPSVRAVRMSVEMRRAIGELAEKWRRYGHALGFGMGIAHGFATLGRIGFEGRFDYSAIGTVVNLAARLCSDAKDGEILIEGKVLSAVESFTEVQPVGELELKGLRRPVAAYNVISVTGSDSRETKSAPATAPARGAAGSSA
jgi:adenylate cyclase